jgi:hypothetical protein
LVGACCNGAIRICCNSTELLSGNLDQAITQLDAPHDLYICRGRWHTRGECWEWLIQPAWRIGA